MVKSVQITKLWFQNDEKNEQDLNIDYSDFMKETNFDHYLKNKKLVSFFCTNPEEPRIIVWFKDSSFCNLQQFTIIGNLINNGIEWFTIDPSLAIEIDQALSNRSCAIKKIVISEETSSLISQVTNFQSLTV
jgi:hypothetical protein